MSSTEDDAEALRRKVATWRKADGADADPPGAKRLAIVKPGEQFDATGRRVIRHEPGQLPETLDQLEAALADYGGNLFSYTDGLVRIYSAPEVKMGGVHRPRGALILHKVDAHHLVELATMVAIHERFDGRSGEYRRCDCPLRVATAYLARGRFPRLRRLSGFIESPTVTLEGRVIDLPGYDDDTGLYLSGDPIAGYSRPPSKPSKDDAIKAVKLLAALFREFPAVSNEDRTAAIAAVITGLVRRVLPAAPMMAITAPTPGTGKTLIAETFAVIASGRRPSVMSLGHDDAEAEKRLGGVFLAGDLCILLDNIERPLKGDLLCQATTQQYLRLRPLGASGMLSIPTHALLVATGNNLAIVGDLKRRVVMIRLDAGQERPEHRVFKRDHLEDVFARRGELIRAALTIPLAYLAASAPAIDGLHPMGGFEQWDRLVRRPLVWLGLPDPLKASEGLRDQDPDLECMREFLAQAHELYGDEAVTAAAMVADGMETLRDSSNKSIGVFVRPAFRDAVRAACRDKPSGSALGYWLRSHRDRIVDGMKLVQAARDGHAKVSMWRIVKCG